MSSITMSKWASLVAQQKESVCNARSAEDVSLIPESGRSPGGGHGNPVQYSCLENLMDREAWQATAPRVAKSRTQLKKLNMHNVKVVDHKLHVWDFFFTELLCIFLFYPSEQKLQD